MSATVHIADAARFVQDMLRGKFVRRGVSTLEDFGVE